jgi:hypothetical protein
VKCEASNATVNTTRTQKEKEHNHLGSLESGLEVPKVGGVVKTGIDAKKRFGWVSIFSAAAGNGNTSSDVSTDRTDFTSAKSEKSLSSTVVAGGQLKLACGSNKGQT